MSAKTRRDPSYRKKTTRQNGTTRVYAVVTLPNGVGGRRDVPLGKYGTKESRAEYRRVIAEWELSGWSMVFVVLAA